ncbi:MAG: SAM-dependent methyltransferase [Pseudomonadota bacterium]
MSPLAAVLERQIALTGPISLAEYMMLCLSHPEHGYYISRNPLGAAGDFTTAPEVSQLFGEMIGASLLSAWQAQGQPTPFALVELGPGRGTLMADILRVAAQVRGAEAAEIWLVETSPALRRRQAETLASQQPHWANRLDEVPDLPLFLVANEFFDALPIRQYVRGARGWQERLVGWDSGPQPLLGPELAQPLLDQRFGTPPVGTVVETCAAGEAIAAEIGGRLAAHPGAAILIDYGAWAGTGDTFQAVRDHAVADPFAEPGLADLTAHVAFAPLAGAAVAAGAQASALVAQGVLLERLGITARAQRLANAQSDPAARQGVATAHRRLTHPEEMGTLFQALALASPDGPLPPGFESDDDA